MSKRYDNDADLNFHWLLVIFICLFIESFICCWGFFLFISFYFVIFVLRFCLFQGTIGAPINM